MSFIDEKKDYRNVNRGYGQGQLRLGSTLQISEDIYSLGFMSQLSDKVMDPYFDVVKGASKINQHENNDELSS